MSNQNRNYCLTVNNPYKFIKGKYKAISKINKNDKKNKLKLSRYSFKCKYKTTIFEDFDNRFYEYVKSLNDVKYFVFQLELGDKEHTLHYQMYIEFNFGKFFEHMKNMFPTARITARIATKKQASDYCKKEPRLSKVYEWGTFAEERERTDWNDIRELIKNGASDVELLETYPTQVMHCLNNISKIRQIYKNDIYKKVKRELKVEYRWGATGTGKTTSIINEYGYENVYRVTNYNNSAFDNYEGQDVIIFEEFRSNFHISEMLTYLDIHPFLLPCRFMNRQACYTKVYIVSNIPLEQQYPNIKTEQPETYNAFLRRIHKVVKWGGQIDLQPILNEPLPFKQDSKYVQSRKEKSYKK